MTELVPIAQPAEHLADATAAWLEVKHKKSSHTAAAYRRDLALWLGWCRDNGIDPLAAYAPHVQLWLAWLTDRGDAGTTRARRLGAISGWYAWLISAGAITHNPAVIARDARPTRAPRPTPALSDEQVTAILAAADTESTRAAAIVWTLIYTGIRVGELLAANADDLGTDRGHRVLHVRGKGGKARVVALVPPVAERLDAHLADRDDHHAQALVPQQHAGAGHTERPLIAWNTGRRFARSTVRELLQRIGRKAGLDAATVAKLTPHSTRATYATAALDDGVPLRDVQYALGHSNPVTTELYDRSKLSPERNPGYRLLNRFTPRNSYDRERDSDS